MTTLEREVGKLEARMETVELELQAIRQDVREIRDALVGTRGGWKIITIAITLATSAGVLVGKLGAILMGVET
jgi:hypothetical protein